MRKLTLLGAICFLFTLVSGFAFSGQDCPEVKDSYDVFVEGIIRVTGVSAPGQNEFMARRAAKSNAMRELIEIIDGLPLRWNQSIKDFFDVKGKVTYSEFGYTVLQYVSECNSEYDEKNGIYRITLQVQVKGSEGVFNALFPHLDIGNHFTARSAKNPDDVEFDSLIINIKDPDFKYTGYGNSVISESGLEIFNAGVINPSIYKDRGVGCASTTIPKAVALLKTEYGVKKPMTVEALRIESNKQIVISDSDSKKILESDKNAYFLASSCVAFVYP